MDIKQGDYSKKEIEHILSKGSFQEKLQLFKRELEAQEKRDSFLTTPQFTKLFEFIQEEKRNNRFEGTKISMHAVNNFLGLHKKDVSLFKWAENKEILNPNESLVKYGFDLTDAQSRVVEGLIFLLTQTRYQGNMDPIQSTEIADNRFIEGNMPLVYKHIKEIPRIRITRKQFLTVLKINRNSVSDIQRSIGALEYFAEKDFYVEYERYVYNQNNQRVYDKNRGFKKETVSYLDKIFNIKFVKDSKTGDLKYYEIEPSAVFLDQHDTNYIIIPRDWREEVVSYVKNQLGKKRVSEYYFKFLLLLRKNFEIIRRKKKYGHCTKEEGNWLIKEFWQDIAVEIRMPESIYKRNKKRAKTILQETYEVALKLGYIKSFERTESEDSFILNVKKYHAPSEEIEVSGKEEKEIGNKEKPTLEEAVLFLKRYYEKLNVVCKGFSVGDYDEDIESFEYMLKYYTLAEWDEGLEWGFNHKFWGGQINSVIKLKKKFPDFMQEYKSNSPGKSLETNKMLLQEMYEKLQKGGITPQFPDIQNGIILDNSANLALHFDNTNFKQKLGNFMSRYDHYYLVQDLFN